MEEDEEEEDMDVEETPEPLTELERAEMAAEEIERERRRLKSEQKKNKASKPSKAQKSSAVVEDGEYGCHRRRQHRAHPCIAFVTFLQTTPWMWTVMRKCKPERRPRRSGSSSSKMMRRMSDTFCSNSRIVIWDLEHTNAVVTAHQ
jgi:hypothetical protein